MDGTIGEGHQKASRGSESPPSFEEGRRGVVHLDILTDLGVGRSVGDGDRASIDVCGALSSRRSSRQTRKVCGGVCSGLRSGIQLPDRSASFHLLPSNQATRRRLASVIHSKAPLPAANQQMCPRLISPSSTHRSDEEQPELNLFEPGSGASDLPV